MEGKPFPCKERNSKEAGCKFYDRISQGNGGPAMATPSSKPKIA
jgi:hypothetical protein